MRRLIAIALTLVCAAPAAAQSKNGIDRIKESEIKSDLFTLAGDGMRGREAGTLDEMRASAWIAERARAAGLQPAGDDGTYFQWWNLRRVRQSTASTVLIDGQPLALWKDIALTTRFDRSFEGPLVWVEAQNPEALATQDLRGKVAAIKMRPPANAPARNVSLAARRYATAALNYWSTGFRNMRERAPIAVVIVADSMGDAGFDAVSINAMRGTYSVDTGAENRPTGDALPVMWVRSSHESHLRGAKQLKAQLVTESFLYPSVNVVAKVPGTDAQLRNEYVLFSAHQDHDGVRAPVDGDSIYNGADDNATVAVAVLAIGRAFAAQPGRRSALFVWHGAEERGLLGSNYHADHPVVPRESIVAVLNADMIGRNHPDTAALMGVNPPHRNSQDLVNMALEANRTISKFVIDSSWDRPDHPEGWYFRSDHLPYAYYNIPSVYFSSLLHADYHTPRDEPKYIDTAKLTRITRWMYGTGWSAANAAQRPRVEPGFQLERPRRR